MIRYAICFLLGLMSGPGIMLAQKIDTLAELTRIGNGIKNMRDMTYEYILKARYPSGEHDNIKGRVYVDNDSKTLLNDCDAFTLLYSANWFYKADHRDKTVEIVELSKLSNKKQKEASERDILQNGALGSFVDSIIIKHAKIKSYKRHEGKTDVELGFPYWQNIENFSLTFDDETKVPLKYSVTIFIPTAHSPKSVMGIREEMVCTNFRTITDKHVYDLSKYFSYNNGKLTLNKYSTYKLYKKM